MLKNLGSFAGDISAEEQKIRGGWCNDNTVTICKNTECSIEVSRNAHATCKNRGKRITEGELTNCKELMKNSTALISEESVITCNIWGGFSLPQHWAN
ncbi:hypothetical protein PIB30_039933 [Stylosanthes scabra]|uniref:Uncharacterized protein n=1 Tax=Stylosanthes scabra TaxID=79078 RepID=A0ABU6RF64_9FABA|nr:hypothetical protein [Stylosanthes scabra]